MQFSEDETMTRVFVYGTLKRNWGNYERLLKHSKFIGEGFTDEPYAMMDAGFPAVMLTGNDMRPVAGEVFEVDETTLRSLDALEGNGRMYQRTTITVQFYDWRANGNTMTTEADIYIGLRGFRNCSPYGNVNEHGHHEWDGYRI
jgi:gamma-glutamylaminecyclotransferase